MKMLMANIAAFLCAACVFCGTVTGTFQNVSVIRDESISTDDFLQPDDLSIGELEDDDMQSSSQQESQTDEPASSDKDTPSQSQSNGTSSSASSRHTSSSKPTASSGTVSSKPQSSTVTKPSSSPAASSKPASSKPTSSKPSSTASSKPASSKPTSSEDDSDYDELVYIVAGAVQREIVGTNTTPQAKYYEAYKAQAVASHTYMEYHKKISGSYPSMSFAEPKPKTIELVKSVIDELIYYNGSLINASYHAASGGHTQSAKYVWGGTVAYLQAVESKYDEYEKKTSASVDAVQSKLEKYGITVSGDPEDWFDLSSATYTDGGFVDKLTVCGQQIKARTLRESILGTSTLMSTKIENIYVSNGTFYFETKGYGHGAGLSQRGALGYSANEGKSYKWILTHYYTGVTVK